MGSPVLALALGCCNRLSMHDHPLILQKSTWSCPQAPTRSQAAPAKSPSPLPPARPQPEREQPVAPPADIEAPAAPPVRSQPSDVPPPATTAPTTAAEEPAAEGPPSKSLVSLPPCSWTCCQHTTSSTAFSRVPPRIQFSHARSVRPCAPALVREQCKP